MAAEKKTKRRQRAVPDDVESTPEVETTTRAEKDKNDKKAKAEPKGMLRLRTDPRRERRFEPTASASTWISVLGFSIGAVLLGAGVYAQWLRASLRPEHTEPHPAAPYLLMAGALVLVVVAFL